jgi:hypothetical protein
MAWSRKRPEAPPPSEQPTVDEGLLNLARPGPELPHSTRTKSIAPRERACRLKRMKPMIHRLILMEDLGRGDDRALEERELGEALRRTSTALAVVHSRIARLPAKRRSDPNSIDLRDAERISGRKLSALRKWVKTGHLTAAAGLFYDGKGKRPRIRLRRARFIEWCEKGCPPRLTTFGNSARDSRCHTHAR